MQETADNSRAESGLLRLFKAIQNKNIEEILALISQLGGYVNDKIPKNADGQTPLHKVVQLGNIDILKLFIDAKNVDLNVKDNHGCTVLHLAALANNTEVLKKLVDSRKIYLNVLDKKGCTALDYALEDGNYEVARILILAGAFCIDESALTVAAECNDISLAEYLVSRSADVNSEYMNGTAFHVASRRSEGDSQLAMIEFFLKNGADVNSQEEIKHNTPLHLLINQKTNQKTVKLLLEFKADVNMKNIYGETPLFATVRDKNAKIVELLLDHGADVNAKNSRGETPLYSAIIIKDVEIAQLLLDRGADVNSVDINKDTPLLYASYNFSYSSDMIKFLLRNGADANARDSEGRTSLLTLLLKLSRSGLFEKTLKFILKYLDVNIIDKEGFNFLNYTNNEYYWKICLQFVAKLQALGLPVISNIMDSISSHNKYSDYFGRCIEELNIAKDIKIDENCWLSYFNLLTDSRRKLKNYAGNRDLVDGFNQNGCIRIFRIYGSTMRENLEKGIKRRELFDRSSIVLSNNLPIFNPNHLIIRDIFDCLTTKDLSKFSK